MKPSGAPALPQHLQPARPFLDAVAQMLADAVLRDLRSDDETPPRQPCAASADTVGAWGEPHRSPAGGGAP